MRILLILFIWCFTYPATAQVTSPTTEEEYNYGATGYKIQLQAKLETKEGYKLKDAEGCEEEGRKIEFKILYRDAESTPCAVIMIFTKVRNAPVYYCIPTSNASPAIWEKFNRSLNLGTDKPEQQLQFFTSCIATLMMNFAAGKI